MRVRSRIPAAGVSPRSNYNTAVDLIYLDNNATTKPADAVVEAMDAMLREQWGNPSSVHRFGQAARQRVELARASVAQLIGARDREIVFTSGGTEADNLALHGVLGLSRGNRRPLLITSRVEHSAVREPAASFARNVSPEAAAGSPNGVEVVYLPVDAAGRIEPASLTNVLAEHHAADRTTLVSVQWVNNETGVIQPVAQLGRVCRQAGNAVRFHVDGTQAVGKMPVNVGASGDAEAVPIDLLSFAAHKFHGPKGVGALWVRRGVRLRPQQRGGPQEGERRGGTENTPGIVGMGVAAELARVFLADVGRRSELEAARDAFESRVRDARPDVVVNSGGAPRLWNTSSLGFPRLEAEAILVALSERGVCASAGAACSSGSLEPSPVLLAMGIPETVAHGSVRFSLSRDTTRAELDRAAERVAQVVTKLAATMPLGR